MQGYTERAAVFLFFSGLPGLAFLPVYALFGCLTGENGVVRDWTCRAVMSAATSCPVHIFLTFLSKNS